MDSPQLGSLKVSDKAVGTLLVAAVVGAVGYGLFVLLPFAIALASNMIYFSVEVLVLVALAYIFIIDGKNTWTTLFYAWRNVARKIRKTIIREDPIGVLDTVIKRFMARLEEISDRARNAVAARKRVENKIRNPQRSGALDQMERELGMAKAARDLSHSELEVKMHATNAKRWEDAAGELQPMVTTLMTIEQCCNRARDLCAAKLDDYKNQKDVMAVKLDALKESQREVRLFKRFFGSNPDLEMQEMAVNEIERQSTEAEAELDQFMRDIDPMLQDADLKKEADALAAMQRFDAYMNGVPLPKAITTGPVPVAALPGVKEAEVVGGRKR